MLGTIIGIAPIAVQLVETIFRKLKPNEKTGSDKLDVATQILRIVNAKLNATTPGAPQATDEEIKAVIETSLAQLKTEGVIPGTAAAAGILATEAIYLIVGGRVNKVTPVA